jgi:hypothetical protein
VIAYSIADWQQMRQTEDLRPRDPWEQSA